MKSLSAVVSMDFNDIDGKRLQKIREKQYAEFLAEIKKSRKSEISIVYRFDRYFYEIATNSNFDSEAQDNLDSFFSRHEKTFVSKLLQSKKPVETYKRMCPDLNPVGDNRMGDALAFKLHCIDIEETSLAAQMLAETQAIVHVDLQKMTADGREIKGKIIYDYIYPVYISVFLCTRK